MNTPLPRTRISHVGGPFLLLGTSVRHPPLYIDFIYFMFYAFVHYLKPSGSDGNFGSNLMFPSSIFT